MRALLAGFGSRGDVQPMVALALGLAARATGPPRGAGTTGSVARALKAESRGGGVARMVAELEA